MGLWTKKIDHIEISSVNIWIIVYASFWTCVNFLGLVDVKMQKEEKKKSCSLIKMPRKSQKRFPLYLGRYAFRLFTWKISFKTVCKTVKFIRLWFLTVKVSVSFNNMWNQFDWFNPSRPPQNQVFCVTIYKYYFSGILWRLSEVWIFIWINLKQI